MEASDIEKAATEAAPIIAQIVAGLSPLAAVQILAALISGAPALIKIIEDVINGTPSTDLLAVEVAKILAPGNEARADLEAHS